jgi:predicted metal-dependent enzyme (double-stranded beta helix superfamily)
MLPALQTFVNGARTIYGSVTDMEERFQRVTPLLQALLNDAGLRELSTGWPFRDETSTGYVENLLFYEDTQYGFVLNALMKRAHEGTVVHDHAHTWTLYGVLRGTERIVRYRRTDYGTNPQHAKLEPAGEHVVGSGYIDLVRPFEIHAEHAGAEPVAAVIFRSQRVGGFLQKYFDLASGLVKETKGPKQVPYPLD